MLKNGTFASPATAFARRVLPVPGGPTNKTPFGILAPSLVNLTGSFKNCTTSTNSSLASLHPSTSLKVTLTSSFVNNLARLFPKLIALLFEP